MPAIYALDRLLCTKTENNVDMPHSIGWLVSFQHHRIRKRCLRNMVPSYETYNYVPVRRRRPCPGQMAK